MRIATGVDGRHRVRLAIVGLASAAVVIAIGLAPMSVRNASAASFIMLYQFQNNRDGWAPNSPPTLGKDGAPYGMTAMGGVAACQRGGGGTVFEILP
jgi:hypothetical protein